MKAKVIRTIFVVLVLGFFGISRADIVELDLFDLGCPTEFNRDSQYWQADFDLGIEFLEIDSVYINWAGGITAGLAILHSNPDEPFPLDVGIGAYFESPPSWRHVTVWGGGTTFPEPELFDCLSEFVYGSMPWSELFDGKGTITIDYEELIILEGYYVEGGYVSLNRAVLRVDGVIVPEPTTFLLLCFGWIALRKRNLLENHFRGE
jgi:hypothetical protein